MLHSNREVNLCTRHMSPPIELTKIGQALQEAKGLLSAIEPGLFTPLSEGPR